MKTKHWILAFTGFALVLLAILWLRPKQSGLVGIYRDGKLIETVDLTKDRTIPLDGAAGGAAAAVKNPRIYRFIPPTSVNTLCRQAAGQNATGCPAARSPGPRTAAAPAVRRSTQ